MATAESLINEHVGAAQPPQRVIQPTKGWAALELTDVWDYRELLYFFTWRDIKVRYKQTVLGAAWAIIQPLATMVVFSVFFGKLAGIPSDGVPYPIFSFTALVPWNFFAAGLQQSAACLIGHSNLVKKVYFPRMVLPISKIISGAVDFAIAFVVLIIMAAAFGILPSLTWVALPALIVLIGITSLGAGLWLSALNVQFRDIRYILPFLIQLWMFATPIAYPASLVPDKWRMAYALNPMVSVIEGFRWVILGTGTMSWNEIAISTIAALILLVSGAFYFRRTEKAFADVL